MMHRSEQEIYKEKQLHSRTYQASSLRLYMHVQELTDMAH